jgi:peroxiredoxin
MSHNAKRLSALAVIAGVAALALVVFVNLRSGSDSSVDAWMAHGASGGSVDGAPAGGKLASDFTLRDLRGHTVSLSSLRGKVVFLNVWATWCPPCRQEMPSIEALYHEFRGDKDFVVLAVSQDTEGLKAVAPYIEKHGFQFTVLLDPRNDVGESYQVSGVPETFIIDRAGRIVAHHVGPYDWASAEMREALQELIKSKQG